MAGKSEFFNLTMPFIIIAWMVFEYLHGNTSFAPSRTDVILFEIVFLNITHNAFTLVMLGLPELKAWREHTGPLKLLGVFLLLWGSFQAILMSLGSILARDLFFLVSLIFPVHHALSQSFGLSLIYNKQGDERVKNAERFERGFYKFFLIAVICSLFVETLPPRYAFDIPFSIRMNLRNIFRTLVFTGLGLILLQTVLIRHSVKKRKLLFAGRYLVWAFAMISPAAASGTKAIHGLEYAFVTHKIFGNSKDSRKWIVLGIFSAVVIGLFYFRYSYFHSDKSLSWLASLSLAVTFFHYYLDRKLFRMRHAINRETVGKLLT